MRHHNSVFHDVLKQVPWGVFERLVEEHAAAKRPPRASRTGRRIWTRCIGAAPGGGRTSEFYPESADPVSDIRILARSCPAYPHPGSIPSRISGCCLDPVSDILGSCLGFRIPPRASVRAPNRRPTARLPPPDPKRRMPAGSSPVGLRQNSAR
ncbi:hypothetical protein E4O86_06155 [Rhizobiales bacterium L72]|uniref:DUF4372 domain-containing protein n=1 Tax=Propylenella binzhouense TaxID=2555902 RepID=A0A964T3L5_9HYPH|nr:hypothetical protein [Propylenella binzhouense]